MSIISPPSRLSCWNYRVKEVLRVVDGDTIDVDIDLGFDLRIKQRVRVAGIDTPEKRTRNKEEKALGIDATKWLEDQIADAFLGGQEITIRTEVDKEATGKYGRLLGWIYVDDVNVSLNEQMVAEGYAWIYDGGTKTKDLEQLREIRRNKGTLVE